MFIKICEKFTNLLVWWVLLALVIGYFMPAFFVTMKPYTDYFFAFTMFGIGALLTVKDFEMIFRKPIRVFIGVAAQFIIMPFLALAIAKTLKLSPSISVGLILAGAVPDAMAAGVISYLADANVAYSVSLTCGTTIVSPIATPLLTRFLAGTMIKVNAVAMFKSIIMIVILPMFIGLMIRHFFKEKVAPKEKIFSAVSTLFIAFICGQVIALNRNEIQKVGLVVLFAVILLNVLGLVFGYLAGKLFHFDHKYCRSLAINVAMQNAGLGAVLALRHIDPSAAIPNALFATWSVVSGSILARYWNRHLQKETDQNEIIDFSKNL